MEPYACDYCEQSFNSFCGVIQHMKNEHSSQRIIVRKLKLCEVTGTLKYVRRDYKYVPSEVKSTGREVIVSDVPDKLQLMQNNDCEPPPPKQEKLEDESIDNIDSQLFQMTEMLPTVLDELQQEGLSDLYVKFNALVSQRKFPLQNIAFLLFMDVVNFYSRDDVRQMRYSESIKLFWLTGYRLFHGKYIRFMGGYKSRGSPGDDTNDLSLNPFDSAVNFVVPDVKTLEAASRSILSAEIKPGILTDSLDTIAKSYGGRQPMKICFDGKKINSCITEKEGDIDLFDCEPSPTLSETNQRRDNESSFLQNMIEKTQSNLDNSLDDSQMGTSITDLHETIHLLSRRIKDMREKLVTKNSCLDKFKLLGKPDWQKSKYQFVVSSIQTQIYHINECISNSLNAINQIGEVCSKIHGSSHLYCSGTTVDLSKQENYVCINEDENLQTLRNVSPDIQQHVLKQKGETWRQVRQTSKVTGSTVYKALGLDTLKSQIQHFDRVFNQATSDSFTVIDNKRMQYGIDHEIDACATITGKILPIYYPHLSFIEEGCYSIQHRGNNFLVISPDGSIRQSPQSDAVLGVEIKCPYPDKKFSTQQMYSIPRCYVTQVLCEMFALGCNELLFVCYTEESSTILKVQFSQKLWNIIWEELMLLYGVDDPKRPKKRGINVERIETSLAEFQRENVTFVSEIPSVMAQSCSHSQHGNPQVYRFHVSPTSGRTRVTRNLTTPQMLYNAKICLRDSADICRMKATEVFLFLISDLDRAQKNALPHAFPIAYGLQGPSLRTETVRKMLSKVLEACYMRNIDITAFSCDGQWMQILHTDPSGKPLTELQKQKRFWETVGKLSKGDLVHFFEDLNVVPHLPSKAQVEGFALVHTKVNSSGDTVLELEYKNKETAFHMKRRHIKTLTTPAKDLPKETQEEEQSKRLEQALQSLPSDLPEKVDSQTYDEIVNVLKSLTATESTNKLVDNDEEVEPLEDVSNLAVDNCISLKDSDITCIMSAMKSDDKIAQKDRWSRMTLISFRELTSSAELLQKRLSLIEIRVVIKVLKQLYPKEMKMVMLSSTKAVLINAFSKTFGDGSFLTVNPRKRVTQREALSLKQLALRCVRKLPKLLLKMAYAEMNWNGVKREWQESFSFASSSSVQIAQVHEIEWYSYPWMYINDNGQRPIFGVVDSHHILTNLRTKCCVGGIPDCQINREAWVKVAKECKNNGSGLTLAHVNELIDKQSNSFAQKTFSVRVEECMRANGDLKEADFCRIIREWYQAEDEPQISSHQRTQSRLTLRDWLLRKYDSGIFPPPGMYVSGIPVVTYESLLTNIERKIQLYSCVPSYNTRAVSTLDAENFFSLFEDLHPTGGGTLKPQQVKKCLQTACQLMSIRFKSDKPFQMMTSRAPVYPAHDVMTNHSDNTDDYVRRNAANAADFRKIYIRDHMFDMSGYTRRKGKRKSGEVSKPGEFNRGDKGVRDYHRRNETKILPHIRLGIDVE